MALLASIFAITEILAGVEARGEGACLRLHGSYEYSNTSASARRAISFCVISHGQYQRDCRDNHIMSHSFCAVTVTPEEKGQAFDTATQLPRP